MYHFQLLWFNYSDVVDCWNNLCERRMNSRRLFRSGALLWYVREQGRYMLSKKWISLGGEPWCVSSMWISTKRWHCREVSFDAVVIPMNWHVEKIVLNDLPQLCLPAAAAAGESESHSRTTTQKCQLTCPYYTPGYVRSVSFLAFTTIAA